MSWLSKNVSKIKPFIPGVPYIQDMQMVKNVLNEEEKVQESNIPQF